jgi:hypothetical protein
MAWNISGTYYAPCSCNVGCPCTFGALEGDQPGGWCSGALIFDITSGSVDGVDVGSTRAALCGDWPKGFLSGGGTGRIYVDTGLSAEQRDALEAVLSGRLGGVFELVGSLLSQTLDTKEAQISIETGEDETRATVGDFGKVVVKPLRGPTGELTRVLHAAAAFRDDIVLGRGDGSSWRDPDMRAWESGGHAEQADFNWSD